MTDVIVDECHKPDSWRSLSLDAGGRSLIEASAGTGKTWTIAVLYLRLLLEQSLTPRQIVVTTFTDAAAEELRERIRGQLVRSERFASAMLDVEAPRDVDAPADEQWLIDHWTGSADGSGVASRRARIFSDRNRLRLAQAELDLAPISTLHGLCRKILADFPFESGSAFGLGEMVSSESLLQTLAEDVWRQQKQVAQPDQPVLEVKTLQELKTQLKAYSAPGVSVRLGEMGPAPGSELSPEMVGSIRQLVGRNVFQARKTKLKNALADLANYLESQPRDPTLLPATLANLVPVPLSDQINDASSDDPEVRRILAYAADAALALKPVAVYSNDMAQRPGFEADIDAWRHWVEQTRQWRQQRLTANGQLTFDELIERVHQALPKGGSALADSLFNAWPVAMVDEFQDTDALQYGILDRIYRSDEGAARGRLVMIGDPKQAIYRFRGGDIHAYLKARDEAGSRLSLDTNYRSSREMVAAFNAFYELAGTELSSAAGHEIHYEPVKASHRCDDQPYEVDGKPCVQPLQLHFWQGCPDDAGSRLKAALEGCANHIVELLASGKHTIGGQPLEPGDIAVLLPANHHIAQLRDLLRARKVPCVASIKSSVFQSDWARELQIVLYAAHHARDEGAVRAALATRLGGKTYEQLRAIRDQPERWQELASEYDRLGKLWRTQGVLTLVQEVIRQATPRLFVAGEGERSLTDLRHLGELLQTASEEFAGPEQLLGWLGEERARRKADDGDAADEMQLRIESDAKRVRLMTLHSSKGLEFPVVMLPLMWANKHRGDIVILHDEASGERIPGCGEADEERYVQEGQDERYRLLYVALTRARHACHLYVLPPARPLKSGSEAPDKDPRRAPLDTMIERMLPTLRDGQLPTFLHRNIAWCNDDWVWAEREYQPSLAAELPPRVVLKEPKTTTFAFKWSFSSLTKAQKFSAIEPGSGSDEDQEEMDPTVQAAIATVVVATAGNDPAHATDLPETPSLELLDLVSIAGAEFGNALHAMFEHREVGRPMAEQHDLIRFHLRDSGARLGELDLEVLVGRLAHRIQTTLDTPIHLSDGHVVRLGALPKKHLRAEMGFDYVLDGVAMKRLRDACARAGEPDLVPRTTAHALNGLMTGKIDLVFQHDNRFYVLDYKGNRLGEEGRLSMYAPAQLPTAMDHSNYRFQALLYVVAVDRYLRQRMGSSYDRGAHLGEAIYLFVRAVGLGPDPGAGVWAHRFSDELIDAVDAVLASRDQEAA